MPNISELKNIRTFKVKADAYGGILDSNIGKAIEKLKKQYPDWNFEVLYE